MLDRLFGLRDTAAVLSRIEPVIEHAATAAPPQGPDVAPRRAPLQHTAIPMDSLTGLADLASAAGPALVPPLVLVESWMRSGAFDHPPPLGTQSVTLLLSGRLRPGSRAAGRDALCEGDLRWACSRSQEVHVAEGTDQGAVHLVRVWLRADPPATCPAPHCHDIAAHAIPERHEPGARVRVFCGTSGSVTATHPAPRHLTFVEISLAPGAELSQSLMAHHRGVVHVLEGTGYLGVDGVRIAPGKAFSLPPASKDEVPSELGIVAGRKGLRALLAAGR